MLMKKILKFSILFLMAFSAFLSCDLAEAEKDAQILELSFKTDEAGRSVSDAVAIAENALADFYPERASLYEIESKSYDYYEVATICSEVGTKSSASDTLMYVVNFKDGGFVLVSFNKGVPPVIAVTETGSYYGGETDNPGFNIYISEILSALGGGIPVDAGDNNETMVMIKKDTTLLENNNIGPFCPVEWHQGSPYNRLCSNPYDYNVPAGCVAVAVAQAMAVFSYPSVIDLTYPGAQQAICELDWNGIIQDKDNAWPSCDYCMQKSILFREIGQRVNMQYASGGSGTNTQKYVIPCLSSFGYETAPYFSGFSNSIVISSLDDLSPVIIRGGNSDGNGHAWLIDGYKYTKSRETYYKRNVNSELWLIDYYYVIDNYYLHMNYGWNNSANGYYLSLSHVKSGGNLNYSVDTDVVSVFSGQGYEQDMGLVYNIKIK